MSGPSAMMLPDGRRLHLQYGPIDLVIGAEGAPEFVALAYRAAAARFGDILPELVKELTQLRQPACAVRRFRGSVAARMAAAVMPHAGGRFVTPMAAVAGAVADEMLCVMTGAGPLLRAHVNNGGDIALHLAPGTTYAARIAALDNAALGDVSIAAEQGIGGIATSGRGGRSLSLGIADSVTVLAASAASADAAATLIANAVDLPGHPAILRAPADTLDPDSDLGALAVVTDCARLGTQEVCAALDAGLREAERMLGAGLIHAAALFLQGSSRTLGTLAGANEIALTSNKEPAHV